MRQGRAKIDHAQRPADDEIPGIAALRPARTCGKPVVRRIERGQHLAHLASQGLALPELLHPGRRGAVALHQQNRKLPARRIARHHDHFILARLGIAPLNQIEMRLRLAAVDQGPERLQKPRPIRLQRNAPERIRISRRKPSLRRNTAVGHQHLLASRIGQPPIAAECPKAVVPDQTSRTSLDRAKLIPYLRHCLDHDQTPADQHRAGVRFGRELGG